MVILGCVEEGTEKGLLAARREHFSPAVLLPIAASLDGGRRLALPPELPLLPPELPVLPPELPGLIHLKLRPSTLCCHAVQDAKQAKSAKAAVWSCDKDPSVPVVAAR